jgi:sporulation protein YlmC with PRC-barrel domain
MKIEDFIGIEVVTSDARVIGNVEGVGVDATSWRVPALKVGLKKGIETDIGIKKPRFGSSSVFMKTEGMESVSDMITLKTNVSNTKEIILEGEKDLPTAGNLIGTRVIARGGRQIGYVDNFIFAPNKEWTISCMMVKLEKAVLTDLGVKKPRIGTPIIKILTDDIKTIGDMVMLKINVKELKDHLDKKPRKKRAEEPEEPYTYEPKEVSDSSKLPFEVNDDYNYRNDKEKERLKKLKNL